jgi:hypothetical protein
MTIHRKTIYVKARALRNMNCANEGDIVHFIKRESGWILQNVRINKSFQCSVNIIRNDKVFEVLEQI